MSALYRQRGFTLVELLVTLTITSLVLLASAPYLSDWTYSRQIKDANSKLLSAYGMAKALALRNPEAAPAAAPAAGIKVVTGASTRALYVCKGDPASAACAMGGANMLWSADFPAAISMTLGGSSVTSGSAVILAINNRGVPTSGTVYGYTLSRGGSANDVSRSLL
jgi:prepilin-type N-terminal cleavage/methylation domain-containing protein